MSAPRAVWRQRLEMSSLVETVQFPVGARLLSAQTRVGTYGQVDLWAEVDPDQPLTAHRVQWVGTGHREVPDSGRYLSTVQAADGHLVFHLYALDD